MGKDWVDPVCPFRKRRGDAETRHCYHRSSVTENHPNYNDDVKIMHSICCWCGSEMEKPHGCHLPIEEP